jgi:hypothetical protein
MTKSQAEAKRRLVGGGLMGQIESFLDTLWTTKTNTASTS